MSHQPTEQPQEHGTVVSYVIGFVTSLIFTFVPYYVVQHHQGGGTTLLLAIMGLAVMQLFIQIEYFLHLGRGPKPRWELYFFFATASMILVVVGGSLIIVNNLHHNMGAVSEQRKIVNDEAIYQVDGKLTGACRVTHSNHQIVIKNGLVSPRRTTAEKCDTITLVNQDSQGHTIAFGEYPSNISYAGEASYTLATGKTKTFTLSQTGSIDFHDNEQPNINGSFLVIDNGTGY